MIKDLEYILDHFKNSTNSSLVYNLPICHISQKSTHNPTCSNSKNDSEIKSNGVHQVYLLPMKTDKDVN